MKDPFASSRRFAAALTGRGEAELTASYSGAFADLIGASLPALPLH